MREFPLDLSEALRTGLRRDSRSPANQAALIKCMKMKPLSSGLVIAESPKNKWKNKAITWPFPQLIRGKAATYFADKSTIYTVNESTFALTQLTTYNCFDQSAGRAITAGGAWHFVDCFDTWALFNGNCAVFQVYKNRMAGNADKVLTSDFSTAGVTIASGCYFRGRIILGGVSTLGLPISQIIGVLAHGHGTAYDPPDSGETAALGTNFVFWSNIGDGAMAITLYFPRFLLDYATQPTTITEVRETHSNVADIRRMRDLLQRDDWGFMPMEAQGAVLQVKALRDHVIVYCADGVFALTPYTEPVSTFGLKPLLVGIGIEGRGAVGGDENTHVFVDTRGEAWTVSNDLNLNRLGYKEYFSGVSNIMGRHDPREEEIGLSGETESFVLTNRGLGQLSDAVTSAEVIDGELCGVTKRIANEHLIEFEFDRFNMNVRGVKNLFGVSADFTGMTNVRAFVSYVYGDGDEFDDSDEFPFNDSGFAFVGVCGDAFTLTILGQVADDEEPVVGRVEVRWNLVDKRNVRGVYAGSTYGEAD